MAEFPFIKLWTAPYLADTRHLSTLEHGAYLLLIISAWQRPNCDLPDDDKMLAKFSGLPLDEWMEIKPVIMEFWKLDGRSKTWTQKRLKCERDRANVLSRSQSDNSRKRWNKTKNDDATGMPNASLQSQSQSQKEEDTIVSPSSARTRQKKTRLKSTQDHPLPDGWMPSLTDRAKGIVSQWPEKMFERQLEKFRNHAITKGRLAKNWDAAFRTWIENADEWRNENGRNSARPNGSGQRGHALGEHLDRELGIADTGFDDDGWPADRSAIGSG